MGRLSPPESVTGFSIKLRSEVVGRRSRLFLEIGNQHLYSRFAKSNVLKKFAPIPHNYRDCKMKIRYDCFNPTLNCAFS